MKVASLKEEVVRRLKNTSTGLQHSKRMETLEDLCQRLRNSGHKPTYIKNILIRGIIRYELKVKNSLLSKSDPKYKPLHQPSGRSKVRMKRKALAKTKWYREQNEHEGATEEGKVGWSRVTRDKERSGAIECSRAGGYENGERQGFGI